MKRILALFLAVLMVALSIPVMASADMTVTAGTGGSTAYNIITADGSAQSSVESVDGKKGNLYGTGEGISLVAGTVLNKEVPAKVWMAYDATGLYFYVEVTDETQPTVYTWQDFSKTVTSGVGVSQTHVNDCVTIAVNGLGTASGDAGAKPAVQGGAGHAWIFRPITGSSVIASNYWNGTTSAIVNGATGYTAEFKVPFTDKFTLATFLEKGASINVQVTDNGVSGTTKASTETIMQSFLNPNAGVTASGVDAIWVWNNGSCYKTYGNGYDKLVAGEQRVIYPEDAHVAPYALGSVTIDGTKDAVYTGDGITLTTAHGAGVPAKVWIAYDATGVSFYVEVEDDTQLDYYTKQDFGGTSTKVGSVGVSQFHVNDAVAININPTSSLQGCNTTTAGVGTVWIARPATGSTVHGGNRNGLTWPANTDIAVGNITGGYSAEIKVKYNGDFSLENLVNNGVSFNMLVTDSGVSGTTTVTSDTVKQSALDTSGLLASGNGTTYSLWVYNRSTDNYKTYGNGYGKLYGATVELESLKDASISDIYLDDELTADKVTVTGVYNIGEALIPADQITVSPTKFDTVGTHEVTITVGDVSTTASVNVKPNPYQTGVAIEAPVTVTIDGNKDNVYDASTGIAVGTSTDPVYGTAYFAYDSEYLYVFVDVTDTDKEDGVADKTKLIGGNAWSFAAAGWNDAVTVSYNFHSGAQGNGVAGGPVTGGNYHSGMINVLRNNKIPNVLGYHMWCQNAETSKYNVNLTGSGLVEKDDGTGYYAEFKIPFGAKSDGTVWDVADLAAAGISVNIQITDGYVVDANDPNKVTGCDNYVLSHSGSNAQIPVWGNMIYTYQGAKADKLTFVESEIASIEAEYTGGVLFVGNTIDTTKLTVNAVTDTGVYVPLTSDEYTVSPVSFDSAGNKIVTVTYNADNSIKDTFAVNVLGDYTTVTLDATHYDSYTVDGVKDASYADYADLVLGELGEVYVGYTFDGIYFFVDVTDATQNDDMYHQGTWAAQNGSMSQSQFWNNDSVNIAINGTNTTARYDTTPNTADVAAPNAVFSVMYRGVKNAAFAKNTHLKGSADAYTGTRNAASIEKNDGSGYYMELYVPFTDGFKLDDVVANGLSFLVEIVDTNGYDAADYNADLEELGDAASARAAAVSAISYEYSNPSFAAEDAERVSAIWKWRQPCAMGYGLNGYDKLELAAIPNVYQTAKAPYVTAAPSLDGTKDAAYADATPLYVKNGDTVLATTWVVYDGDYMYLYSEVVDSTKVITDNTTNGNITPALKADSFIVTLNFENKVISNLQPNANDTYNVWGGRYTTMRGATSKNAVTGTYAQTSGWETKTVENGTNGYIVETKIPLKNATEGKAYTVDTTKSVAILTSVNDNTVGTLDGANCVQYHSGKTYDNGKIQWNTGAYTFKNTTANDNVYDELVFLPAPSVDVTIDVDGETTTDKTAADGSYTLPEAPAVDGALFLGWEYGENFLPAGAEVTLTEATTIKAVLLTVDTLDAAEIRLGEPTGLRFITIVDKDSYDALSDTVKAALTFGTVVLPADKLEGALTKNSSYTANEKNYPAVTIVNTNMNTQDAIVRQIVLTNGAQPEMYEGYAIQGVLNVRESNYARSFAGRGYIDVAYTDASNDTVYASATANRCTADVADAVIENAESNGIDLATRYTADQIAVLEAYAAAND